MSDPSQVVPAPGTSPQLPEIKWSQVGYLVVTNLTPIVVCLIAAGILWSGMRLLRGQRGGAMTIGRRFIRGEQPLDDAQNWRDRLSEILQPHALQLIGLTFILPVILANAALKLDNQALNALLGAMVGYIFGVGGTQRPSNPSNQNNGSGDGDGTRTPPNSPDPSEANKQTGRGDGSAPGEAAKPETPGDDTTPGATGGGLDQTGSGEAGTPNPATSGLDKPKE